MITGNWWQELDKLVNKFLDLEKKYIAFIKDYGKTKEINNDIVEGLKKDYINETKDVKEKYEKLIDKLINLW